MPPKAEKFVYRPEGAVLREFMLDRSPVSIIQGPVGSGTSTACCMKMWKIATEQKPDRNGVRRTKWIIVRNTFEELKGTTLDTWTDWFEDVAQGSMGQVKMTNPPSHDISWPPGGGFLEDGTRIEAEFLFLSLDQEEDKRKLLSREMTGVWFNEVQFAQKAIFDIARSRAQQGRYPPQRDGGPTWNGVIADLNAPPEGHWLPYMRGDVPFPEEWDEDMKREYRAPPTWKFFVQPPGLLEVFKDGKLDGYVPNDRKHRELLGLSDLDAVAENIKWLKEPYLKMIEGQPKAYIDTYIMNRVGLYREGRPVFESFRKEIHIAKDEIKHLDSLPLIVGLDFARNPAAVVVQVIRGVVYVLDEYGAENVSAGTFAPMLRQRLVRKFPKAFEVGVGAGVQFWGDPSGGSKGQATDSTPYSIFLSHGMAVSPAPGNNSITLRLEAVQAQLDKMVDGRPAFISSKDNRVLNTALGGGYHFGKVKGHSRYHEAPNKDRYADYADALQYALLGAGLGFSALNPGGVRAKPVRMRPKKFTLRR
jgi:hypothetical protein